MMALFAVLSFSRSPNDTIFCCLALFFFVFAFLATTMNSLDSSDTVPVHPRAITPLSFFCLLDICMLELHSSFIISGVSLHDSTMCFIAYDMLNIPQLHASLQWLQTTLEWPSCPCDGELCSDQLIWRLLSWGTFA